MSARRAALILWCVLMIVLPLPVWQAGHWGGLPALRSLMAAFSGMPLLGWHALMGMLVAAALAWCYRRWAERLPVRIRGALVGLLGLTALTVLSAVPVYRWPADMAAQTFIEIYRPAPLTIGY